MADRRKNNVPPKREPGTDSIERKTANRFVLLIAFLFVVIIVIFITGLFRLKSAGNRAGSGASAEPPKIVRENLDGRLDENQATPTEPNRAPSAGTGTEASATRIFFVKATEDGRFDLKGARVIAPTGGSNVENSISALLQGPSSAERNRGAYTMIPVTAKLLSAKIEQGVAYLNFNEDFLFNTYGPSGCEAQLKQIIYTATEDPSVQSVQIMIENKITDYLAEGVYIGKPLAREDMTS